MIIRQADTGDEDKISDLITMFRVELKQFKGINSKPNKDMAKEEFKEYMEAKYPIFVAEDSNNELKGYIVCKINGGTVWAESLYVTSNARREGVASELFKRAEELAFKLGGSTVYNWVHPNNDKMIAFLARRGYNTLNLIEIRKTKENEVLSEKIRVGMHEYYY